MIMLTTEIRELFITLGIVILAGLLAGILGTILFLLVGFAITGKSVLAVLREVLREKHNQSTS